MRASGVNDGSRLRSEAYAAGEEYIADVVVQRRVIIEDAAGRYFASFMVDADRDPHTTPCPMAPLSVARSEPRPADGPVIGVVVPEGIVNG